MNFEDFNRIVGEVRRTHPIWFGMEPDETPSEDDVREAEIKLGISFPVDYKAFLRKYGGGYFALSNVYSLDFGSDWNLLRNNLIYDSIRSGHLLFSENGMGDFYGFAISGGECGSEVFFYDHEIDTWKETMFNNIFEYLCRFALERS